MFRSGTADQIAIAALCLMVSGIAQLEGSRRQSMRRLIFVLLVLVAAWLADSQVIWTLAAGVLALILIAEAALGADLRKAKRERARHKPAPRSGIGTNGERSG